MIRKLQSGEFRLYSRKADPKTGRRRNLGTFASRELAEKPSARSSISSATESRSVRWARNARFVARSCRAARRPVTEQRERPAVSPPSVEAIERGGEAGIARRALEQGQATAELQVVR